VELHIEPARAGGPTMDDTASARTAIEIIFLNALRIFSSFQFIDHIFPCSLLVSRISLGILFRKTLLSGMIEQQYKFFGVSENLSRRL
jgi:hypothetical protein